MVSGKPVPGGSRLQGLPFRVGERRLREKTASGAKSLNAQPLALSKSGLTSAKASQSKKSFFWIGPFRPPIGSGTSASCSTDQNHSESNRTPTPIRRSIQGIRFARSGRQGECVETRRRSCAKNALSDSKMDITYSQQDFKTSDGEISVILPHPLLRKPVPS